MGRKRQRRWLISQKVVFKPLELIILYSINEKLEAIKKWDEGGVYRIAAHTALGALGTGSIEGALTTGGVAAAAPTLDNFQKKISDALVANGMSEDIAKGTANGVISLALLGTGSAVGLDTSSTVTATNVDANNRWLHTSELNQIFADGGKKIKEFAKVQGISYEEAWRAIVAQAYRNTDDKFRESHTPKPGTKESTLAQASEIFLRKNALITSTAAERANSSMNRNSGNILKQVEAKTPSYTTGQKNRKILNKVGSISAEGGTKGIGNIPSDTANAYANVIGKEVPRTFPYSSEGAELVGGVAQNVAGFATLLAGIKTQTVRANRDSISRDVQSLQSQGIKVTSENVVLTGRDARGNITFLETGNSKAGLQHIVSRHADDFNKIGVATSDIPAFVMKTIEKGVVVGYQGKGTGRPIYQTEVNGQKRNIAISVGNNGFVVGANPTSSK